MRIVVLGLILLGAISGSIPASALAHVIDHLVFDSPAKVVEVFYADGRAFSFESFEVIAPGDRAPFLIGRTDKLGRVVFVPDRPGEWAVKVWSEDGHGMTTTVLVEEKAGQVTAKTFQTETTAWTWNRRLIGLGTGLIMIFGLGAVLFIQLRRKQP